MFSARCLVLCFVLTQTAAVSWAQATNSHIMLDNKTALEPIMDVTEELMLVVSSAPLLGPRHARSQPL
jgi:hypothetical protein